MCESPSVFYRGGCCLDAAEHFDSTRKKGLTKLPPLTHTYTIEDLRPKDNPYGRFLFS